MEGDREVEFGEYEGFNLGEAIGTVNGQLFAAGVDEPDVWNAPFVVFAQLAENVAVAVVLGDDFDGDERRLCWDRVGSGAVVEDTEVEEADDIRCYAHPEFRTDRILWICGEEGNEQVAKSRLNEAMDVIGHRSQHYNAMVQLRFPFREGEPEIFFSADCCCCRHRVRISDPECRGGVNLRHACDGQVTQNRKVRTPPGPGSLETNSTLTSLTNAVTQ